MGESNCTNNIRSRCKGLRIARWIAVSNIHLCNYICHATVTEFG